ncbi:MAG TPA: sugar phosphate nucleotidyltransferase [Gemmatimonadales bacterium]|nr:sugar phosphate nucleotidyltransferase [Gemmatimonadales bacterium]
MSSPRTAPFPDVVVLAGGLGTRIRGVLGGTPKVLAPVHDRPFLALLLDLVQRSGGRRVILAVGHQAGAVERVMGSRYGGDLELLYSRESAPAGTGGAIALAARLVRTADLIALNGDSIVLEDLGSVYAAHERSGAEITIVTVPIEDKGRFGSVQIGAGDRIVGFVEKTGAGAGAINAGVYVLPTALAATFPVPSSLERDVLPKLLAHRMQAYRSARWFIDMGTPASYQRLLDEWPGKARD